MIILEGIIKMNDIMERKYIRIDCVYYEEDNDMMLNYYRAYKRKCVMWSFEDG